VAPKPGDRAVVMIEQRETAKAAFDAVDRTVDSITATVFYLFYNLCSYREAAKE